MIRTPTRATGGITDEEREKMKAINEKWIKNAFRTTPADKKKLTDAIKRLYEVSGLPEPQVVIVPSPLVMALAYGLASGWWELQGKNKATYMATRDTTYKATYDAIRVATGVATDRATDKATHKATRDTTYEATYMAIDDATYEATEKATYYAIRTATDKATDKDNNWLKALAIKYGGSEYQLLLNKIQNWHAVYQGGAYWTSTSYMEAMRDVIGLSGLDWSKYQAWEDCAKEGCFRAMHSKFCIVSDFPVKLSLADDGTTPHCIDEASHRWSDGFEIYHLWGVRFTPDEWKEYRFAHGSKVIAMPNADKRAMLIRAQGAEKIVKDCGGKVVATDEFGELVELEGVIDGNGRPYRFLKAPDPSKNNECVWLRCSPDCQTPAEAEAKSYRLNVPYNPTIRV